MVDGTSRLAIGITTDDVARARGEYRGFTEELRRTWRAANDLERSTERAADSVDDLGDQAKRAEPKVEGLERAFDRLNRGYGAFGSISAIRNAAVVVAGVAGFTALARGGVEAANAYQEYNNRLKLVTESEEQLIRIRGELFDVSQRTFNQTGATIDLYSRLARSTEDLALGEQRLLGVTESINQLVALSGTSQQAADAALFQLGQGLGAGALRGEELNSILEQTPELARAIADGLGVTIAELRALGAEGALTAEAVIRAIEDQADATREAFESLDPTFAQLQTKFKNTREVFLAEIGEGIIDNLTEGFGELEQNLASPELLEAARNLGLVLGEIAGIMLDLVNLSADLVKNITASSKQADFKGIAADIYNTLPSQRLGVISQIDSLDTLRGVSAVTDESIVNLNRFVEQGRRGSEATRSELLTIAELINDRIQELELAAPSGDELVALLGSAGSANTSTESVTSELVLQYQRLRDVAEEYYRILETDGLDAAEAYQEQQDFLDSIARVTKDLPADEAARVKEIILATDEIERQTDAYKEHIALVGELNAALKEATLEGLLSDQEQAFGFIENQLGSIRFGRDADFIKTQAESALAKSLSDAAQAFGVNTEEYREATENANDEYERIVRDANDEQERIFADFLQGIAGAFSGVLNDLIFNGGQGIGNILSRSFENIFDESLIRPITEGILEGNPINAINGAFDDFGTNITKVFESFLGEGSSLASTLGTVGAAGAAGFGGFSIGQALGGLVNPNANLSNQLGGGLAGGVGGFFAGGSLLTTLGSAAGPVGALIGAALGAFAGSLFGKSSDEFARGTVDLGTGTTLFTSNKNNNAENIQGRNSLIDAIGGVTQTIAELTGAQITENLLVSVGSRDGIQLLRDNGRPGNAAFTSDQVFYQGQDPEAAIGAAVRFATDSLQGGSSALVSYARAAADAGRGAEEIVGGLQSLKSILDLTTDPISGVEQALKRIDEVTQPVINDLLSLGQSIESVSNIAAKAVRAIGVDFIEGIQNDIDRFQNATLADFRALLKGQEQINKDAATLLDRGALTEDEFNLVAVRNSLAQRRFFEGLSQDELNDLGDYVGLVRETGGELAVVLLEIQTAFDDFIFNGKETVSSLREEGQRLLDASKASLNLRDDILRRLSPETQTQQLGTFRGELEGLLAQGRGGNVDAIEKIPEIAQQYIQLAERVFGASGGLADARDYVANILEQNGTLAGDMAQERFDLADATEQQIGLLTDIKTALETPDPSLDYLAGILQNNELQNTTLRDLLDQYVSLAYSQPQNFTVDQVQAATNQIVSLPSELTIANTVQTEDAALTSAIQALASQTATDAQQANEDRATQIKSIDELTAQISKLDSTLRTSSLTRSTVSGSDF